MADSREIVMYSRTFGCPFVSVAKRVFADFALSYREIMIDKDAEAKARVVAWTGFQSVPTLVIAEAGGDRPIEEPAPLPRGSSPRGIDRGYMITEPSHAEMKAWLVKHGFISSAESAEAE
ncbi:MAG: glutaredoxin family protein [Anaerolineae bacterium]|nr:glutaredoxin family protein [Anaerolineae bacterium]